MKIKYIKSDTVAVADENIEEWYQKVKGNHVVFIATELQLLRLRTAHVEKEIILTSLSVGEEIHPFEHDSKLEIWPKFTMITGDLLCRIIGGGMV